MLCSLIAAAIGLVLPLGAGYITDNVLAGDLSAAPGKILGVGALLLGLVLVQALCSYFMDYQGHAIGARMERDMRAQLFAHCQRLSFSYFDSHPIGDLMSRLTNDSLSLAEFFHHVPEDVLVNSIKFVGASLILWHIHWQMTLVILCFLPFMLAYTLYFNKKMAAALKQGREDMGEINAQAEDTLSAIRMVQSFGNEAVEAQKFHVRNEKFLGEPQAGLQGRGPVLWRHGRLFQPDSHCRCGGGRALHPPGQPGPVGAGGVFAVRRQLPAVIHPTKKDCRVLAWQPFFFYPKRVSSARRKSPAYRACWPLR